MDLVSGSGSLAEELRARGLRLTAQRQLVLEAVYALGHATPSRCTRRWRKTAAGVNITTVYRTLELLEELGLVTHTHLSHGSPTYHAVGEDQHVHLVCRACGAVGEVASDLLHTAGRPAARRSVASGSTSDTSPCSASAATAVSANDARRQPGAVAVEAIDPTAVDAGVAAHYGDPMREQRLLATAVGLVDRGNRDVIAVPGEDRLRWLHSLTTQHSADLRAGPAPSCWCSRPHGHVEQHAVVARGRHHHLARHRAGRRGRAAGLPGEDALPHRGSSRPTRSADWAVLSLVGPRGRGGARAARRRGPGPARRRGGAGAEVRRRLRAGRADDAVRRRGAARRRVWPRRMPVGVDLLVPARRRGRRWPPRSAVPLAGLWAYEALRVADRRPRLGFETDHRTIPAEVGLLAPAVHLDKGCYRGQETVARVHHLGRPPRRLVLLHLDGMTTDQLPAPGHAGDHCGRPRGRVRRHRGPPLRARPGRARRGQAERGRRRPAAGRPVGRRHRLTSRRPARTSRRRDRAIMTWRS